MNSCLYTTDVFRMACRQFDLAADTIDLPEKIRERTKYPKRSLSVSLPLCRDDGSVEIYEGFRVQHHLALGPTKGGVRLDRKSTRLNSSHVAIPYAGLCSIKKT